MPGMPPIIPGIPPAIIWGMPPGAPPCIIFLSASGMSPPMPGGICPICPIPGGPCMPGMPPDIMPGGMPCAIIVCIMPCKYCSASGRVILPSLSPSMCAKPISICAPGTWLAMGPSVCCTPSISSLVSMLSCDDERGSRVGAGS